MDYNKGKTFQSNERMFKKEKALYFPNLVGSTLSKTPGEKPEAEQDSCSVMRGKISIVGMQSGRWAEEQVESFLDPKKNPDLREILTRSGGLVQQVDVNMQSDWIRMMLVRFFKGRLRRIIPEDRWGKYFMVKLPRDVRRGLTEEVRDAMGLLNSQVGYVYLVDTECRIRWAGSGYAWDGEVEGLNRAVQRLMQEETSPQSARSASMTQRTRRPVEPPQEAAMPATVVA